MYIQGEQNNSSLSLRALRDVRTSSIYDSPMKQKYNRAYFLCATIIIIRHHQPTDVISPRHTAYIIRRNTHSRIYTTIERKGEKEKKKNI